MLESLLASLAVDVLGAVFGGRKREDHDAEQLASLVRERLAGEPAGVEALTDLEQNPEDEPTARRLQDVLVDVTVADHVFAGKLFGLVSAVGEGAESLQENPGSNSQPTDVPGSRGVSASPVRGFPGLTVTAASPQTTAGTNFSIFVLVQNPFDVPITIHQVQTHIPVELVDVNWYRAALTKLEESAPSRIVPRKKRRNLRRSHPGVAVAVGTDFTPEDAARLFSSEVNIGRGLHVEAGGSAHFSAVNFIVPPGASSDDLDALMRRVMDYKRGTIPVTLQPGDSVVRQFVLRTRSRLLFRPLSHTFRIQVNYSVDGVDHTGTIPFNLDIQAALASIAVGATIGAALGTGVKSLGEHSQASLVSRLPAIMSALVVSTIASVVVIAAFARKNSAQPLVSVEDFWGGLVIGFAVGYLGFQQFLDLLPTGSSPAQ